MQAVAQEEVVRLVDAPGLRVVERDEPRRDATDLDRLEDLADRRQRLPLSVGKERERPLLGVRARLALVRDDVHRSELTSRRAAERGAPSLSPRRAGPAGAPGAGP